MKTPKKLISALVCAVTALSSVSACITTVYAGSELEESLANDSGLDYDFARALQYSIYFYDANMCGTEVDENNLYTWRGDCHTYDSTVPLQPMDENSVGINLSQEFIDQYRDILDPDGDGCVDVAGGFHDAGDHVEFGMPENYSAATLGWGYYEFRDSYVKTGQDSHMETILRYFNDYLMKCTFRDSDGTVIAHCYQVGDGDIDHAYWNSPEIDEMARPAFFLTADKPQTDYVVSAAASLAINYLNFKDTDPEYAAESLDYAKALFQFANDNPKELSDNADGPKGYYRSEKWEDDYVWAAAWLYKATEDVSYLNDAMPYIDYYAPSGWAYCWNDVWSGALTILGEIDLEHPELDLQNMYRTAQGKTQYEDADFWLQIEKAYKTWSTNYTTDGGYAFLNQWGSARYNTAMQLVCLVYDKYKNDGQPGEASYWAKSQMEYLMGDNPLGRSYIVGYNENSAKFPHHRAASGLTKCEDTDEQRYVLYGALVGGPDGQDNHIDVTSDYIYNEVTIDYNAAFVGACAGLYEFFGTDDMQPTTNFPPTPSYSSSSGGNSYWVKSCGIDDKNSDGCGVTKVSLMVMTDSTKGAKDITVRYYFDASEISDVNNVKVSELYDQAAVEASPADGVISGPYAYDKMDGIYYAEIKWDGYTIANSGKKYQFTIGMYYGDKWDPDNDPSYQGLTVYTTDDAFFGTGNEERNDYICVYSDGVLVGGIEPDGSTPVQEESTTEPATENTTTAETTVTTAISATTETYVETTSANDDGILWGDANLDNEVNVADAVKIMSYASGPSLYPIDEKALPYCDVYSNGDGINNMDALSVQKYSAQIVKTLPES